MEGRECPPQARSRDHMGAARGPLRSANASRPAESAIGQTLLVYVE